MSSENIFDNFIYEGLQEVTLDYSFVQETTGDYAFLQDCAFGVEEPQKFFVWSIDDGMLIKQEDELIINESDQVQQMYYTLVDDHGYYSQETSSHDSSFEKVMKKIEEDGIFAEEVLLTTDERNLITFISEPEPPKIMCNICNHEFVSKTYLKQHILYKHTEKPYQCPTCSKKFSSEIALENHLLKHKRINKPLVCEIEGCGKAYVRKYDRKRHYTDFHMKEERRHVCTCGKSFSRRDHLQKHKQTHVKKIMKANNF